MDAERALIAKCIDGAGIEQVVARGVGPQHFVDDQNRAVFQTVVWYMTEYGQPPTRDVITERHPGYRIEIVPEPIEYVLDSFSKKVQRRVAQEAILDLAESIDKGGNNADFDALFMEHTERVAQAIPTSRVTRLSAVPNRIELYNKMRKEGRLPGISVGVPSIDKILLGVQPHELVVFTAPSNVGKSTFLQYVALTAYMGGTSKNDTPAFITLEMKAEALMRKFDAMATNFRYNALRALSLDPDEMRQWEEWGERVDNAPNDIIVIDDIPNCTVERVFAETLRYKPNAMFVDYFGLMTPSFTGEKQFQGMAQMAKDLKKVPQRTGIPLFTAAQTNRAGFKEGVRADNVADTIEIFRSADIMLGLERDEEDDPFTMFVKLVKARDSGKGEAEMHWDMSTMNFYEKGTFDAKLGKQVVFSSNPSADTPTTKSGRPSIPITLEAFTRGPAENELVDAIPGGSENPFLMKGFSNGDS